jgi:hypothetical protein
MPLVLNGTTGVQDNSGAFVQATAVASTSGTSIDFTSIPSWAKRVTVMFNESSTNGTSSRLIQVGTSGGVVATGYVSSSSIIFSSVTTTQSTAGFLIISDQTAHALSGQMIITNVSGNTWVSSSTVKCGTGACTVGGGSIALGGVLDRIRMTTVNGTDTFDAGSINITWE